MTFRDAFIVQADHCTRLGSPFTATLLQLLAKHLNHGAVFDTISAWDGDITSAGDAVALRVAGGLHALVLTNAAPALAAVYPPHAVPAQALWAAVDDALDTHEAFLLDWMKNAPQTNEVRRSAVLIGFGHFLAEHFKFPMRLSELGASGGLNLFWDCYALEFDDGSLLGPAGSGVRLSPDWSGARPPKGKIVVTDRRGVDLNPLHIDRADDVVRLRAYTWADQLDRLERLDAAISMAKPAVDQGDAAAWLENRLADRPIGQLDLIFNTIAWQYFPPRTKAACTATMSAAGARATPQTPMAWLSVEADGAPDGALISLRLWPGDGREISQDLGRMDFHGRWVKLDTFPDF